MYVCMYVCTYVCMYVRRYVCMYVCMYVTWLDPSCTHTSNSPCVFILENYVCECASVRIPLYIERGWAELTLLEPIEVVDLTVRV